MKLFQSKKIRFCCVVLTLILGILQYSCKNSITDNKNSYLQLYYDEPATDWMTEALPIGNAFMGAMLYGGVKYDSIQLNEETMWSGGPGSNPDYFGGNRIGAYVYLDEVRKLVREQKFKEAVELINKYLLGDWKNMEQGGTDYGANQTLGSLIVSFSHDTVYSDYKRKLNLKSGVSNVSFTKEGKTYEREYFASYPDKVIAARYLLGQKEDVKIYLNTPHVIDSSSYNKNSQILSVAGHIEQNKMPFTFQVKVQNKNGSVLLSDDEIIIQDCDEFVLYQYAFTNYKNEHPNYSDSLYPENKSGVLEVLDSKTYKDVKDNHIADYQKLFNKVEFNLGHSENETLTTDERLKRFAAGEKDPSLAVLYFQFGRYLMISSSRPGSLPAHLQGKWNNLTAPKWRCDYHTNINLQMNYWPVEVTGLSESALPLMDYINHLRKPGSISAREMFGTRGWTTSTMTNVWGYTASGRALPWGYFPGAGAWLSQHVWDHFEYNQDTAFLDTFAYPIMKEAALFWLDYLTPDRDGYLVSNPSFSPEHGGISEGATMDHQIAWDIFSNTIAACRVLNKDMAFLNELEAAKNKILPLKIGRWGQLQEWKEDVDDSNNKHRHVSHLFGLHPGRQISIFNTPELAEAARVSLDARGDKGTGWSIAWKINFRARLHDAEKAYEMFQTLLNPVGKNIIQGEGGGTYSNLLCAHPPFQIDGNFGGTAGIAEMLLQSHDGIIALLPALPDEWKDGQIKGLKARGGFTVDIIWKEGKLKHVTLHATVANTATIRYQNEIKKIMMKSGETKTINF